MRLLQLLLVESLRSHDCLSGTAGILRGLQHEKIAIALHLIHEKPDIDWQIAHLASHCAMSRSSFLPYSTRQSVCRRCNICSSGECRWPKSTVEQYR
jgi:AraC-like DNA-binding protein